MKYLSLIPFVLAAAPALAAPRAELSTGVEHQQGEFGTGQRIETLTVNNAVRIDGDRLSLSAQLPWHRQEAPGNVVGGGGGLLGLPIVIDPTRPPTREVREGVGDLRIGAGYRLPVPGGIELGLAGEAKLPTAARGLGTGAADLSVSAEASKRIGDVTPFVAVGYAMPGDPEGYDLRNALFARGGVAAQLAPRVRAQLAYGYAQSVSPLVPDEQKLSGGLNAGLGDRLSLGLYGSAGLSAGAADMGAGLRLGWRIF
ncbi:MAG: hypothetical protein ACK4K7_08870 [Allosphingosinicella sp.]|uniref:transporter n=1 Tax=Allosphingosinicella sp. TaxID=2823234 RepID=UPI003952DA3E